MSWNNVIPGIVIDGILDDIRKEPKQLHFDEAVFLPCYTIKEEYITDCNEAFTWIAANGHGPNGTLARSVDHPAFAALRKHLDARGYIKMQTGWTNGDRVVKPFYLNEVYFAIGDKFLSASAMQSHLKYRKKNNND